MIINHVKSYDGVNVATYGESATILWHQRLGHMSEKCMKVLISNEKIMQLETADDGFCESGMLAN